MFSISWSQLIAHELNKSVVAEADALISNAAKAPQRFRRTLQFELSNLSREDMDFVPGAGQPHHGASLVQLPVDARRSVHSLLRAVLSPVGYLTANSIMSLEEELRQIQAQFGAGRLSDNCALEIFGVPSKQSPWGWKFEGHHLSINVLLSGTEIRVTPLFLGASPAEVRNGPRTGFRIFAPHIDMALELMNSMSPDQLEKAQDRTGEFPKFGGIVARGNDRKLPKPLGIQASEMGHGQKQIIVGLVRNWIQFFQPAVYQDEMKRIEDGSIDALRILWRGE